MKSIGIDLDAIGDKLTEIGNQIAGAFDSEEEKQRKIAEQAAKGKSIVPFRSIFSY